MGVYLTFLLTMSSRGGSGIGGSPRALVRACAIANAKEKEGKKVDGEMSGFPGEGKQGGRDGP
jgi:hypothetical protein